MNTAKYLRLLLIVLFALSTGIASIAASHAEDTKAPAIKPIYDQKESSEFTLLAKATLDALNAEKKEVMVAKLTDLETAWDEKEPALKPRDEKRWTTIDKTLDKAISALRGSKYNAAKGKAALELLIKEIAESTKP